MRGAGVGLASKTPKAMKSIPNLFEYVEACVAENAISPELVMPGDCWEVIHHPRPKSLGGTTTKSLKKSQHAVQGLLQSEYYNKPCIFGWEGNFLTEDWQIALYRKWMSRKAKIGATLQSVEGKRKGGKACAKKRRGIHAKKNRGLGAAAGAAITNSKRFKCMVTGHVSTGGGLTSWQKKRGIDTCMRKRVK